MSINQKLRQEILIRDKWKCRRCGLCITCGHKTEQKEKNYCNRCLERIKIYQKRHLEKKKILLEKGKIGL